MGSLPELVVEIEWDDPEFMRAYVEALHRRNDELTEHCKTTSDLLRTLCADVRKLTGGSTDVHMMMIWAKLIQAGELLNEPVDVPRWARAWAEPTLRLRAAVSRTNSPSKATPDEV